MKNLTLKDLRKGKIAGIETSRLELELTKIEEREAKYLENLERTKVKIVELHKTMIDRGEDPTKWGLYRNVSEERKLYDTLKTNVDRTHTVIRKLKKKKELIETELIERTITGQR